MILDGSIILPGGCELVVWMKAKRHRSSPPAVARPSGAWLPSRAWLASLRCKSVCCSLADYGASTPLTTSSAKGRQARMISGGDASAFVGLAAMRFSDSALSAQDCWP
jgi:hypothetical protein